MSDAFSSIKMLMKLVSPLISFFSSDRKRRKERDYLNAISRIDELENRQTKTPRSEQLCKDWYAHINVNLPLWSVRQLRQYPKLDCLDLKHPGANAFVQNHWLFPHDDKTRTITLKEKSVFRMKVFLKLFVPVVASICACGILFSLWLHPLPKLSLWFMVFSLVYAVLFASFAILAVRQWRQIRRALMFWQEYSLWQQVSRQPGDEREKNASKIITQASFGAVIVASIVLARRKWKI
jgi:hypothetical protein